MKILKPILLFICFSFTAINCSNSVSKALFVAIENYNLSEIKELIESGADINYQDKNGQTPLMHTLLNYFYKDSSYDIVEYLIKAGADINKTDNSNRTALCIALNLEDKNGFVILNNDEILFKIVELLISKGANIEDRYFFNPDVLHYSICSGKIEITAMLLFAGMKIEQIDSTFGRTPVIWAADCGQKEILDLLIGNNADINIQSVIGETALILASGSGHYEIVQTLLENNVEVNATNFHGETALMSASRIEITDIALLLLDSGIDVNAADNNMQTALMNAVITGRREITALLLERGADIQMKDIDEKTALEHAISNNQPECIELLISYGARLKSQRDLLIYAIYQNDAKTVKQSISTELLLLPLTVIKKLLQVFSMPEQMYIFRIYPE